MFRWLSGVVCGFLGAMTLGAFLDFRRSVLLRRGLNITDEEEERLWNEAWRGMVALDKLKTLNDESILAAERDAHGAG